MNGRMGFCPDHSKFALHRLLVYPEDWIALVLLVFRLELEVLLSTMSTQETPLPEQAPQADDPLSCRMYEQKYPNVDDLVVVKVNQIAEMGAYVSLLEYNNIEGMILLSELSRRRIRSINKLIRVGRNEVAVVLRVDKDKGIQRITYMPVRLMH